GLFSTPRGASRVGTHIVTQTTATVLYFSAEFANRDTFAIVSNANPVVASFLGPWTIGFRRASLASLLLLAACGGAAEPPPEHPETPVAESEEVEPDNSELVTAKLAE